MTRYEQEYYHNVKKISESLESIAHSLEVLSEINIKVNADIDSKELFNDEDSCIHTQKLIILMIILMEIVTHKSIYINI